MPDTRIDLYLGYWYAAQVGHGDPVVTQKAFRDLIQADQDFRKEAEAKLATYTPVILQRDHVSRVAHDILTKVLA